MVLARDGLEMGAEHYLEARTPAISALLTIVSKRSRYVSGDSSSTWGFGTSTGFLLVDGRGELSLLPSATGEDVVNMFGPKIPLVLVVDKGPDEENKLTDKRWSRGGLV